MEHSAHDLFNPAPTPQEFQAPAGDRFFVGQDGQRAMLGSEEQIESGLRIVGSGLLTVVVRGCMMRVLGCSR